jgi:hypothetical protein
VVFWHAKGWTIFQALIAYMRRRLSRRLQRGQRAADSRQVALWETSGHWEWYRENMFAAQSAGDEAEDKRWFALKPMNCPGHVQIFKHGLKSYRDLPLRLAEFGVVHRYEPSGAMHGLMRVRGFTQDDAHVFCTEAQLADEVPQDQRPDPVDLCRFRLRGRSHASNSRPAGKARRHRRDVGSCRARDGTGARRSRRRARQPHQDRDQSRRRRVLRPEIRICAARRHRPRLAMRHHAGRLQPAGTVRRVLHRRRRHSKK